MTADATKKVIRAAMGGKSQIAAAAMTRSSAVLPDAIHSAVDTGNRFLPHSGVERAGRPQDGDEVAEE